MCGVNISFTESTCFFVKVCVCVWNPLRHTAQKLIKSVINMEKHADFPATETPQQQCNIFSVAVA